MRITQQNWKWWALAAIAAIFVKSYRRPIGIVILIFGLPYFYHLLKRDDMASPMQLAFFLTGLALIWLA